MNTQPAGVTLTEQTALAAGHAGLAGARSLVENGFKIELGTRAVARAASPRPRPATLMMPATERSRAR